MIRYSEKYFDDVYEYRHAILPNVTAKLIPRAQLMSEEEWRSLGVQQSKGWIHYMIHKPEPYILLFRRPLLTKEFHTPNKAIPTINCNLK